MRLLILSALVATCFCWSWNPLSSTQHGDHPPSHFKYEPGKEYVYKYESQVLNGLPTFSKQYSGLKVVADAKFVFSSLATLQLDNVQVLSLNKEIQEVEKLPPTQQLSLKDFTPLSAEDNRLIASKLQQQIKFEYNNNKVEKLEVCSEDTNWSVDIKRGILGILQVKLQADSTDYQITEKLAYNQLDKENVTTFDTLEPATDGTCYSSLHVFASHVKPGNYRVIKARDHSRCIKLNVREKNVYPQRQSNCNCRNNMNGQSCECRPVSNLWNSTNLRYDVSKTDYLVQSSDGKEFVIKEARQAVETRIETPHTPHQHVLTVSNHTLIFREARSKPSVHSPASCPSFQSVSEPWKLRVLAQEKPMMTPDQIIGQARKMLSELVTITSQVDRFDDQIGVFYQLISNLRLCTKSQLTTLFSENKPSNSQGSYRKWKLYLDALRQTNTTDADKLIINKVISEDISQGDAISVFVQWTADKVPTVTILDEFQSKLLPGIQGDAKKKMVYQHAILCFGAMVRRYIHSEEMEISRCILPVDRQFHQKNIDNCRKYEKYVEGRLSVAQTDEEKITLLKAIANLGSIKTLPMLQSRMVDTETLTVRVHAIWAVKNMGFQNQRKVLQTLLPIMLHRHADSELRVAAFVMTMKCNPTASLLELKRHLNEDPDRDFKTFVVKYMRNMLDTEQPECENCNMRVRQVLKSIRAFRFSSKTTDFQMKYGLKTTDGQGDMIRVSTVGSKITAFPQSSSIQHFTGKSHQWNHLWEIGYRAEGMEALFFKHKSSAHSILRQSPRDLGKHSIPSFSNVEPSLTLYVRVLGQQVSFLHMDKNTIASLIMAGSSNGSIELPLTLFNTMITTPKHVQTLQPSGFLLTTELSHVGIIDIDGKLKIELPSGRLPIVTFETKKPMRFEVGTHWSQKTDAGFATTGLSSIVKSRAFVKTGETKLRYDAHHNMLIVNSTDESPSTNTMGRWECRAHTVTTMIPARLPHFLTTKDKMCKPLAVDESEKKEINYDLDFLKSIELDAKVKGEVNAPELYSFVRDRMLLLPTYASIYKQEVVLDIKPQPSSRRTYKFNYLSQFFVPTKSHKLESGPWSDSSNDSKESSNFFGFLWSQSEQESSSSSSEESHDTSTKSSFFQPRTLGSLCTKLSMSLASVSENKVLNMTVNITAYHEHDDPTIRTLYKFVRPPITAQQESEKFQWTNEVTRTMNPGLNQVVQLHKIRWGPKSKPDQKQITITAKFTPTYKDQVCNQQNAYGCKDQYGVSYPIWYKNSLAVESVNTDIPKKFRDTIEPYLINNAESVYMYPNQKPPTSTNKLNLEIIVRPYEDKVDYICYGPEFVMNTSRVFSPMETKLNSYITENHYPISSRAVLNSRDVLPIHHFSGAIGKHRNFCTYKNNAVHTFERKVMIKPNTDCEILLSGDCGNTKDFAVTMIPDLTSNLPKIVKVKLGEKIIELDVQPHGTKSSIQVKVDGQHKNLNQGQLNITDQSGHELAILGCPHMERCHLLSAKKGVYINVQHDLVAIEMNKDKANVVCGMCAKDPQLPVRIPNPVSMEITRQNLIPGKQCTLRETHTQSTSQCSKKHLHRVLVNTEHAELQKCVTVDRLAICSQGCKITKHRHPETAVSYCVSEEEANTIGLKTYTEGSELVADVSPAIMQKLMRNGTRKNIQVNVYDECQ